MRLATRLSLSYIGFVALLSVLVLVLAAIQIVRLANDTSDIPMPASAGDAMAIARHLGTNGLGAPIPAPYLENTLNAGGWTQVLDAQGREVQAVSAPADRQRTYLAAELTALGQGVAQSNQGWYYELRPIKESHPGTAGAPATESVIGMVVLAAPTGTVLSLRMAPPSQRIFWSYFFTGLGMAVLTAVALALLAGFWYARHLTRPLERLSKELQVAAAGDFTHRIPAEGRDEFAVLARSYNHLVERLAAAEAERNKVEQARRDLVANISHDLRTPLTSIQGFTEAMADESTPPETRRRHAATIAQRITALNGMLGDLLELSRLQALPEIKREPADLPELIREQVIGLMPEIEAAGLDIDVDMPEGLAPVPVDQRLIGRAVQNLLVNAVRHSGGARRIGVTLQHTATAVAITISDDGQGIPAADLPMLFDRYYQGTSATNAKRGTGLGLAIVRQIAENHGGRITVDTAEGRGTSFTLWLPTP